jgi:hypothetical protein
LRDFLLCGVEGGESANKIIMKQLKFLIGAAIISGIVATSALAADQGKPSETKAAKPYPLKTCIVSGEKLGGDMGKPYVFVEQGQEVKLCCKNCLKDFKKEPAKYLKKIAEAKEAGPSAPPQAPGQHPH